MSRKSTPVSFVSFLKTPAFEDRDTARRVRTLEMVMLPVLVVAAVFSLASFVLPSGAMPGLVGVSQGAFLGLCGLAARKGFVTQASAAIVFLL